MTTNNINDDRIQKSPIRNSRDYRKRELLKLICFVAILLNSSIISKIKKMIESVVLARGQGLKTLFILWNIIDNETEVFAKIMVDYGVLSQFS